MREGDPDVAVDYHGPVGKPDHGVEVVSGKFWKIISESAGPV